MKSIALLSAFVAIPAGLFSQSQSINFGSDLATGLTSTGSAWVAGVYTFQMGVFNSGFTPTVGNVNDWSANWTVANQGGQTGTATWLDDGGDLYFAGTAAVTSLSAPFAPGSRFYIWGYDSRSAGTNQWILLTSPSWLVATNIDTPVNSNFLTTDAGVTAVVGTRTFSGSESFTSAAVLIGAPIPEPSAAAALGGLIALGAVATRRRRSA